MMRIRTSAALLICCCAGLTACTAGSPKGPDTTVSAPRVGRPAPPTSAQAALSHDAFTPYAALGLSNNDGLAPNQSVFVLGQACMAAAGYPGLSGGGVGVGIKMGGPASLSFAQPWGAWGYLGAADAQQYGFLRPPGSALAALGVDAQAVDPATLPPAEQTAANKCSTIVQGFSGGAQNRALAGITTLSNDIYNDVQQDAAVKSATSAWAACMTRNGFSFKQPQTVFFQEIRTTYGAGNGPVNITGSVSPSARQAQLAAAVTDANCTESTDLAGIYFAVLTSYEQQLVNANQQALNAAVRQYKANYAKELSKLPALLRTASATLQLGPGKPRQAGKPSPTHS